MNPPQRHSSLDPVTVCADSAATQLAKAARRRHSLQNQVLIYAGVPIACFAMFCGACFAIMILGAILRGDRAPAAKFERVGSRGALSFVWIEPAYERDPEAIKEVIRAVQRSGAPERGGVQKIMLWADRALTPDGRVDREGYPMTEAQVEAMAADYWRNKNNGKCRLTIGGKEVPW